MKDLRIVFMGTPEFAVATLGSLLMNGFNVVGVVTAPDKPAGRGQKISFSAVKEFAVTSNLQPLLQPENLKDPLFIQELKALNADLFVVVAFRMLPAAVWKLPPMGTINLHASLLPQYRGSAPINHAIINGETGTGVTTFFIDDKIDTGSILLREEVPIFNDENAGDLHNRLMKSGARLVINTINGIAENNLKTRSQAEFFKPGDVMKNAPKINPEFCIVDWSKDAHTIHNFIRGLAPYPCARSFFGDENKKLAFKIYESHPESVTHNYNPGQFISDGKKFLKAACKNGLIEILSLQLEGKKRMSVSDFLRGFRISDYAKMVS
jgi:methionyl-tRNA formyltransferase